MLKEFAKVKDLKVDLITSSANNKFEEFCSNVRIYKPGAGKKDVHSRGQGEILRWLYKAYSLSRKMASEKKYDCCHSWFGFPPGLAGMTCIAV